MRKKRRLHTLINRNSFSIEDGLKDVIDKIGNKGLKEATGKGYDTFYKMSNPTHAGRYITVNDAVKIDRYCRRNGLGNPLLDCFKTMVNNVKLEQNQTKTEVIQKSLLRIVEEFGDISSTTREAIKDGKIEPDERTKIGKEIRDLEVLMTDLKQKLQLGEETDYSAEHKYRTEDRLKSK